MKSLEKTIRSPGVLDHLSEPVRNKFSHYRIIKDACGMSPAEVYRLENKEHSVFLKRSSHLYRHTTYDVKREYDTINWLSGKVNLPCAVHYEETSEYNTLLMSEMKGKDLEALKDNISIADFVEYYVQALLKIQSVDIAKCPHNNCIDNRLKELRYLIDRGLADTNADNWEENTNFTDGNELYEYLIKNKPEEDYVFSHGDLCNSNIFIDNNETGFIDLGRCGIADKWLDIAFCTREIRELTTESKWIDLFFDRLGLQPDWEKIKYFILLDELF